MERVLYAPKFDLQTAGIWLSPVSPNKNLPFCTCFHLSYITVWQCATPLELVIHWLVKFPEICLSESEKKHLVF
jgi:hypothetical protein